MQHKMSLVRLWGRHSVDRPVRLLVATAALALAGGLMQTAAAAPYSVHGGPGPHAATPAMPALAEMGGMGGLLMAHPRRMERWFDGIGATPQQRAQIKLIAQAARDDLRALREADPGLREQGRALFVQPTVDEAAAEALRQQLLARHDQASKRMMQALLEASRVLTPDQRKAIVERMAERRALMERHRAEHEPSPAGKR